MSAPMCRHYTLPRAPLCLSRLAREKAAGGLAGAAGGVKVSILADGYGAPKEAGTYRTVTGGGRRPPPHPDSVSRYRISVSKYRISVSKYRISVSDRQSIDAPRRVGPIESAAPAAREGRGPRRAPVGGRGWGGALRAPVGGGWCRLHRFSLSTPSAGFPFALSTRRSSSCFRGRPGRTNTVAYSMR